MNDAEIQVGQLRDLFQSCIDQVDEGCVFEQQALKKLFRSILCEVQNIVKHLKDEQFTIDFVGCDGVSLFYELLKFDHKDIQLMAVNGFLNVLRHFSILDKISLQVDQGVFNALVNMTHLSGIQINPILTLLTFFVDILKNGVASFHIVVQCVSCRLKCEPYSNFVNFLKNRESCQDAFYLLDSVIRNAITLSFYDEIISMLINCGIKEGLSSMKPVAIVTKADQKYIDDFSLVFCDRIQRLPQRFFLNEKNVPLIRLKVWKLSKNLKDHKFLIDFLRSGGLPLLYSWEFLGKAEFLKGDIKYLRDQNNGFFDVLRRFLFNDIFFQDDSIVQSVVNPFLEWVEHNFERCGWMAPHLDQLLGDAMKARRKCTIFVVIVSLRANKDLPDCVKQIILDYVTNAVIHLDNPREDIEKLNLFYLKTINTNDRKVRFELSDPILKLRFELQVWKISKYLKNPQFARIFLRYRFRGCDGLTLLYRLMNVGQESIRQHAITGLMSLFTLIQEEEVKVPTITTTAATRLMQLLKLREEKKVKEASTTTQKQQHY